MWDRSAEWRRSLLIPESCWQGETGAYLLQFLRMTPYGEWNTAFLPANQWTSAIVGTPLHPGAESPEFVATIRKLILDCKADSQAAAQQVEKTGELELMAAARNKSVAVILTVAKQTAMRLAEIGKPKGPDHRAGLSFLSLQCIDLPNG